LGGGSLRSLIVLIILGLAAMSAQKGLLAQVRVVASDNQAIDFSEMGGQSLALILSRLAGADLEIPIAALATVAMLAWVFARRPYRREFSSIATGTIVGLVIAF